MTVAAPRADGYGWGMDDSARLRAEVERRADARPAPRAPITQVIHTMATREAQRRGLDVDQFLDKITDPDRGDELLRQAEYAARQERLDRQAEILLARLPALYRNAEFPKTDFGDAAREWLQHYRANRIMGTPPRSLVILGATGTGKTWTACAIARALLAEDTVPCTVTTVSKLMADLRPASGGLDVDLLQFTTTPVLVLDDLGMERPTEWVAEMLYRIAHDRSHNGRPTIVTSNLTGAQIRARYDLRTVERLFGGAKLIEIAGETRRPLPF